MENKETETIIVNIHSEGRLEKEKTNVLGSPSLSKSFLIYIYFGLTYNLRYTQVYDSHCSSFT